MECDMEWDMKWNMKWDVESIFLYYFVNNVPYPKLFDTYNTQGFYSYHNKKINV
jgi:hypothetical protein